MNQLNLLNFDLPLTDREVLLAFPPGELFTRKNLADRLGRSKSPTLIARLNALAEAGMYDVTLWKLPNEVDMYVYQLSAAGAAEQAALQAELTAEVG